MNIPVTYDPKRVIMVVGAAILSGYAEGTFITAARHVDLFTLKVGNDGYPVRSKSSNISGEMTITLQQTSPSNSVLAAYYALDEAMSLGVVPVIVKDLSSGTALATAPAAWVRRIPNFDREAKDKDIAWMFDCAQIYITPL